MKIATRVLVSLGVAAMLMPAQALGINSQVGKQKTFSGIVSKLFGNQITFKTSSGAVYTAETSTASLVRKNGAAMKFSEVIVGDKLQIKGTLWSDNSMNASYVRNMSLYTHTGTFSGKITGINPVNSTITIQSSAWGQQLIRTDSFTVYKKNTASATFSDLQLGYSVSVKGLWDRSRSDVMAKEIKATVRMVNITFTGTVSMVSPSAITVVSNNTIYGVKLSGAKLLDKKGKTINASYFAPGHTVRVKGKHVSESVNIDAVEIKNSSVTK